MKDKIRFKLPVGAVISGMRHLGEGEFIAELLPPGRWSSLPDGNRAIGLFGEPWVPLVIQAVCPHPNDGGALMAELCEDPLDSAEKLYRSVYFLTPSADGVLLEDFGVAAETVGVSRDDYNAKVRAYQEKTLPKG